MNKRRWLMRLSFSFLLLAFVLGWESYKATKTGGSQTRAALLAAGAAASFGLGLLGVRERHRPGPD